MHRKYIWSVTIQQPLLNRSEAERFFDYFIIMIITIIIIIIFRVIANKLYSSLYLPFP